MADPLSPAVRDNAGPIAYLAERFAATYYANDPDWERWLADLRAAVKRMDADV